MVFKINKLTFDIIYKKFKFKNLIVKNNFICFTNLPQSLLYIVIFKFKKYVLLKIPINGFYAYASSYEFKIELVNNYIYVKNAVYFSRDYDSMEYTEEDACSNYKILIFYIKKNNKIINLKFNENNNIYICEIINFNKYLGLKLSDDNYLLFEKRTNKLLKKYKIKSFIDLNNYWGILLFNDEYLIFEKISNSFITIKELNYKENVFIKKIKGISKYIVLYLTNFKIILLERNTNKLIKFDNLENKYMIKLIDIIDLDNFLGLIFSNNYKFFLDKLLLENLNWEKDIIIENSNVKYLNNFIIINYINKYFKVINKSTKEIYKIKVENLNDIENIYIIKNYIIIINKKYIYDIISNKLINNKINKIMNYKITLISYDEYLFLKVIKTGSVKLFYENLDKEIKTNLDYYRVWKNYNNFMIIFCDNDNNYYVFNKLSKKFINFKILFRSVIKGQIKNLSFFKNKIIINMNNLMPLVYLIEKKQIYILNKFNYTNIKFDKIYNSTFFEDDYFMLKNNDNIFISNYNKIYKIENIKKYKCDRKYYINLDSFINYKFDHNYKKFIIIPIGFGNYIIFKKSNRKFYKYFYFLNNDLNESYLNNEFKLKRLNNFGVYLLFD